MATVRVIGVVISMVLFLASRLVALPSGASLEEKLRARVTHYDSRGQSFVECILELAYQHQLPAAIQYLDRADVQQPLSVKLDGASVEQIISALVTSTGNRVVFSDGFVQVYSPAARSDPSNLLNTFIDDFVIRDLPIREASARLLGLMVQRVSPRAGFGGHVPYGAEPQRELTLRLQKARVYEILDSLIAADGASIWVAATPRSSSSTPPQAPPWEIYDLRPATKNLVLERLRHLFP